MRQEPVDILIIGSGASGGAFAWSMADTRLRILCLEQGDWMDPARYRSTSRDGELRQMGEFSFNPNVRGRVTDYPIPRAQARRRWQNQRRPPSRRKWEHWAMESLKADWPLYLTSAAIAVTLLTWLAKWLGLLTNGGSTPAEVFVFCVALPWYLREAIVRIKDEGQT